VRRIGGAPTGGRAFPVLAPGAVGDVAARVAKLCDEVTSKPRNKRPSVQVLCRGLSTFEITAFYRAITCYVSASCGEGFGFA
jgi:hypothetical protein